MFTIYPIHSGTLTLDKSGITYCVDEGVTVRSPVITYLILPDDPDDERVVFVDGGAAAGELAGRDIENGGPDPIREGLAGHGLEPTDVDHLILTHLHHDHAANVAMFSEAEVLLQREELAAARDPLPHMKRTYVEAHRETVLDADLTLVDGGFRLCDGIELRLAPGHTRGMQAVIVETSAGPHAIVADLIYCEQNLAPDVETIRDVDGEAVAVTPVNWPYIPPGLHVDAAACYESIDRLTERVGESGVLLSGHMPAVLDHDAYPA